MQKKIGVFGGTFDPIHFGHLNLAIEIKEKAQLDEVIFVPAYVSPFKVDKPSLVDKKNRYEMVKIAIEDIGFFSICDYEIQREEISFTIDTLKHIQKEIGGSEKSFHLILSEDSLPGLELWKDIEEILRIAPPLIGSRKSSPLNFFENFSSQYMEIIQRNLITTNQMDISSTELRKRLKEKLYCGHLIPAKVLDYIYKNELYYPHQI